MIAKAHDVQPSSAKTAETPRKWALADGRLGRGRGSSLGAHVGRGGNRHVGVLVHHTGLGFRTGEAFGGEGRSEDHVDRAAEVLGDEAAELRGVGARERASDVEQKAGVSARACLVGGVKREHRDLRDGIARCDAGNSVADGSEIVHEMAPLQPGGLNGCIGFQYIANREKGCAGGGNCERRRTGARA